MAEFMHIQDSRHSSQNNLFCVLNEDINKKPSHKLKGRFWNKKFCFLLMCGTVILFMALLITVSVKLQHQYSKVSEVENEVANLTSSLALLSSNQQDTSRHQNSKLTEVENEVANLTSSLALLSSNQQDTLQHQNSKLTEVENEVANLTSSLALLSSNQKDTLQHQNSKLTEVENEVANLTSSLALLSSNQKDTLQHQNSKLTEVENEVANLTSSLALLSSNQQETLQHQNSKLTEVENEVANLTSSLALLSSNQQDTYDRFMEMVGELKADLDSRITNLTQHKPVLSCKAGWQPFLSNCYEFSSQKLSWQKARSYCSGKGTLMLILGNDSREWDFIVQHAVRSSESYWIGLTDMITGHWRWVDGTPYTMNSRHWEPGEPNNWRGEEDCGELTASGKLNDGNCSKNFRFICKAPASEN
ncbi:C-type lectin domain family 10 member A isoform X5 [Carassius gibelio]|uniref:C-type lectin domain family 10 member A isoform X5 n=1 Tax=Carassius gibelio TaxID=101364 RepID=UPI002279C5D9|nr:C-type lectin domain family 10 member A isoform X5 [Carassius gibelio]